VGTGLVSHAPDSTGVSGLARGAGLG